MTTHTAQLMRFDPLCSLFDVTSGDGCVTRRVGEDSVSTDGAARSRSTVVAFHPSAPELGSSSMSQQSLMREMRGEERERETSQVGGQSSSSAHRRARRRERRQKNKEGDAEMAVAGMSFSGIAAGSMMKEILQPTSFNPDGDETMEPRRVSENNWVAPLINLMGGTSTIDSTAAASPPADRGTLRRGKKNLLSGWFNDVHSQKRDDQIVGWMEQVPLADVSMGSAALFPPDTNPPPTPAPNHAPSPITGNSYVRSLLSAIESSREESSRVDDDQMDELFGASMASGKLCTTAGEDPDSHHFPVCPSPSQDNGATTDLLSPSVSLPPVLCFDTELGTPGEQGFKNASSGGAIRAARMLAQQQVAVSPSGISCGMGESDDLPPLGELPPPPRALHQNSRLARTDSFVDHTVSGGDATENYCIATQPAIHSKTSRRPPTSTPKVSLNESVYNLDHWDESELGHFVVPTDNVREFQLIGAEGDEAPLSIGPCASSFAKSGSDRVSELSPQLLGASNSVSGYRGFHSPPLDKNNFSTSSVAVDVLSAFFSTPPLHANHSFSMSPVMGWGASCTSPALMGRMMPSPPVDLMLSHSEGECVYHATDLSRVATRSQYAQSSFVALLQAPSSSGILVPPSGRRWADNRTGGPAADESSNASTREVSRSAKKSYSLFSSVVAQLGVTVDTLTHGATNHTLQLAQPLTGDSARAYRCKEAARVLEMLLPEQREGGVGAQALGAEATVVVVDDECVI
jgi:hypothetical protein